MSNTGKIEVETWNPEYDAAKKQAFLNTSLEGGAWHKSGFAILKTWIKNEDKKVIEVGCGTAKYTIALAGLFPDNDFYALDFLAASIELVSLGVKERNLSNVTAIKGDITDMPFPKDTFDVLFSEGVLEHFDNYEIPFQKMLEAVKPGGKVIVSVPNWLCFPHTIYKGIKGVKYEHHYEKSFTPWELKILYRKYGLENIEAGGYFPAYSVMRLGKYFPPLWGIGRLMQKLIIDPLDAVTSGTVSKYFGFFTAIKGEKKRE